MLKLYNTFFSNCKFMQNSKIVWFFRCYKMQLKQKQTATLLNQKVSLPPFKKINWSLTNYLGIHFP